MTLPDEAYTGLKSRVSSLRVVRLGGFVSASTDGLSLFTVVFVLESVRLRLRVVDLVIFFTR